MAETSQSMRIGRQALDQCRREIEAGWEQVAAGRRILEKTRWLLQRWAEQTRWPERAAQSLDASWRPGGGTFVTVEDEPRDRLKFKRRGLERRAMRIAAQLRSQASARAP
jgi:hypothetical protein